jgi:glycosyltransferase involved in cell wall biosynthesis
LPDLSILICSLYARAECRERLLTQIATQPKELLTRCQVILDIDGGETSIGMKRNRLLNAAYGRYIVFIDDDDAITEDYLASVFVGIELGVDHIGVGMLYAPLGGLPVPVECSVNHEWGHDGIKYLRSPQHVCAVKRELALEAGFPDISFGEDKAYSARLTPMVTSEYVVEHPIYIYQYGGHK